jgi:hypothetical protein
MHILSINEGVQRPKSGRMKEGRKGSLSTSTSFYPPTNDNNDVQERAKD